MKLNNKEFGKKVRLEIKICEFTTLEPHLICDNCRGLVDYCLICEKDISKPHVQAFCGDASTKREPQHVCEACADRMGLFEEDEQ